jgi:hypothetical protein
MVRAALIIAVVVTTLDAAPQRPAAEVRIAIHDGSRPDGTATDLWLTLLRRRLSPSQYDSVAVLRLARSPAERAWLDLIRIRSARWPNLTPALLTLFDSLVVDSVRIVVGDRGADDAFTHDSLTIGFDLSALQRVYGDAAGQENPDRLDRFFRHEFVHLLQKRWLRRHPYAPTSPLEAALFDAWAEGLGNYYSLSSSWGPTDHVPSPLVSRALHDLEPRLVGRMSALACADSLTAGPLLAGLSSGPFDQKWGALPVALWLLAEVQYDPAALHHFATAGPAGFWELATHHLTGALRDSLVALRDPGRGCPSRRGS